MKSATGRRSPTYCGWRTRFLALFRSGQSCRISTSGRAELVFFRSSNCPFWDERPSKYRAFVDGCLTNPPGHKAGGYPLFKAQVFRDLSGYLHGSQRCGHVRTRSGPAWQRHGSVAATIFSISRKISDQRGRKIARSRRSPPVGRTANSILGAFSLKTILRDFKIRARLGCRAMFAAKSLRTIGLRFYTLAETARLL